MVIGTVPAKELLNRYSSSWTHNSIMTWGFNNSITFFFSSENQILSLCPEKNEIAGKVHSIIDKFAERGLRSLGVAFQVLIYF